MRRIGWLAAVLSFSAVAGTPVELTPAQQQAIMDSGTQFGQGALSVGVGAINSTGGAAGVPSYNTTPSGQSPGGAGLFGPATAKQTGCDGYTAPAGAGQVANQQDCDAVDFLVKHHNPKSAYPINPKTDHTIQAGRAVLNAARDGTAFQAGGVAAGFGVTGTTTQTECQTATATTSPETTTTSSCYIAATLSTQTCDKTLNCVVTQSQPVPATVSYSCSTGTLSGTTCIQPTFPASVNYQCSAGSTLSGTTCQPAPATATLSYSCTSGTLSGTQCLQPATSASVTYLCPSGSTLSGTSCIWPAQQGAPINATVSYTVAATWIWQYNDAGNYAQIHSSFFFWSGQLVLAGYMTSICDQACFYNAVGSLAYYTSPIWSTSAQAATVTSNFCSAKGYAGGSVRFKGYDTGGGENVVMDCNQAAYSCPSGYTLSGTMCYPSPTTPPPTAATPVYSCPSGSTLSGASCLWPSTAATASYSCPTGSSLSGTLCYPAPYAATVVYTCPSGNTLSGTTCQPPATQATVTYSCGTGSTYDGTQCVFPSVATCTWTDHCIALQALTQ